MMITKIFSANIFEYLGKKKKSRFCDSKCEKLGLNQYQAKTYIPAKYV